MTLRCKPGDIAIVEHDDPPCVGNIRHVVRVIGSLAFDSRNQRNTWLIEPLSSPDWLVCQWPEELTSKRLSRDECVRKRIEHPDAWLRPIRKTGFDSLAEILEHVQRNSTETKADLLDEVGELLP